MSRRNQLSPLDFIMIFPWWVSVALGLGFFVAMQYAPDWAGESVILHPIAGNLVKWSPLALIIFGGLGFLSLIRELWQTFQRASRRVETPEVRPSNRRIEITAPSEAHPACPSCGQTMILKTAQKGRTPGKRFWGCSGFPHCRGTRKL